MLEKIRVLRANGKKHDTLYRACCSQCGSDRGFKPKTNLKQLCMSCRSKQTWIKNALILDSIQDPKDGNRRRYLVCCYMCGKEKGYRRTREHNSICKNCHQPKHKHPTDKKLLNNIRTRVSHAIKHKSSSTRDLLGLDISLVREYLESKFYSNPRTGEVMSWDNHGINGWHIDHIRPLISFDLAQDKQLKEACHYTNLQPLWWFDNLSKGMRNVSNK